MRAVVIETYGGPEVLHVADLPVEEPGPGELLIDVRAAGVGFSDLLFRMGLRKLDRLPAVLGYEVAGTVVARGADVALAVSTDLVAQLRDAGLQVWMLTGDNRLTAEAVARQVDFILIPTRPAILDLRAIARTVEFVRRAGRPAAILLNAVPPGRGVAESSVTTEARRALAAYGLPIVPTAVGQRAALAHALNDGRAVTEFEPDGKAAEELRGLWRWCHAEASAHAARRDRADVGDRASGRRTG
jgi:hypothetical protein